VNKSILGLNLRSLLPLNSSNALQAARVAARRCDWSAATVSYRAYLAEVPDNARAWVQYGHALKEAALLTEAEEAYQRAAELDPEDDDPLFHLGHLLNRLGPARQREAAEIFAAMEPPKPPKRTAEALNELLVTGNGVDVSALLDERPAGLPHNAICVELKDLFQYLSLHTTVTGITRVTLSLVNYILYEMDEASAARYHFVHQYGDGEGVMLVTKDYMRNIVRAAMHETPHLPTMQELVREIRGESEVFRLAAGDTYLIVGAFWEFVANPSWLAGMRYRGVTVGSYIYDLIPITYAQYCAQVLTDAFTLAFSETARLLSFAMTISSFVADEVTEYLDANGIPRFPIEPVLLAHELRFEDRSARRSSRRQVAQPRPRLIDVPFVLCVCTIEARKNHAYLFSIWQRMIDDGIDVPELVFVGRPGWRVEDLMLDIENSNYLDGRLHILNGLSDDELASLYDQCLFTAFPSFVEGWGLPVGESLSHGKVCVASSTSSVPEVGGSHAVYVDPFDLENGYTVISDLIRNPEKIVAMERALRDSFQPRTWADVGRDFFATTERLLASVEPGAPSRDLFAPRIPATKLFEVGRVAKAAARGNGYVANPERLAFVTGWGDVKATGTWMLDPTAKFRIQTDCGPSQQVSVLLHAGTSEWVNFFNVLSVKVLESEAVSGAPAKPAYRRPMQKDSNFWLTLTGRTDEAGILTIEFDVSGPIRTADGFHAPVAFRLHAVGYAPADALPSRIELLEGALLSTVPPEPVAAGDRTNRRP
jgi:glycosyltransferase involved in cell wall biosynthesis